MPVDCQLETSNPPAATRLAGVGDERDHLGAESAGHSRRSGRSRRPCCRDGTARFRLPALRPRRLRERPLSWWPLWQPSVPGKTLLVTVPFSSPAWSPPSCRTRRSVYAVAPSGPAWLQLRHTRAELVCAVKPRHHADPHLRASARCIRLGRSAETWRERLDNCKVGHVGS
jgi:hypothetical protein